jgi:hypothetical protein
VENPQSNKSEVKSSGLAAFWQELKRRKVMRVGITYAVVAWLVIQVAVSTFPTLRIPDENDTSTSEAQFRTK